MLPLLVQVRKLIVERGANFCVRKIRDHPSALRVGHQGHPTSFEKLYAGFMDGINEMHGRMRPLQRRLGTYVNL